jgi:hypothetical protein
VNTAKVKPDVVNNKPQRSSQGVRTSGLETRRAAKSPLVLRLLEEQEPTEVTIPLVYSPDQKLQTGSEEEALYYHQAPQGISDGGPKYAEPQAIEVCTTAICQYQLWYQLL